MSGFNPPSPFEMAANQFTNPQQTPDYEFASANAADSVSLMNETGEAQKPQEQPIQKLSLNFGKDGKGTVDVKMSQQAAQTLQEMLSQAQTTNKATDLLIRQYASKRDVLQQNPIIAQLGKYASLAATAYQAPGSRGEGLVRAAGAYGGDYFKDSPEELQAKIVGAERSKFENIFPIQQAISQDRRLNEAEARSQRMEALQNREANLAEFSQFAKPFDIPADQKGAYTKGSFVEAAQPLIKRGVMTQQEAETYDKSLDARATATRDEKTRADLADQRIRQENMAFQSHLAAQARLGATGDAKAAAMVGRITSLDEKMIGLYQDQERARGGARLMAASLGMPMPRTKEEAQVVINSAIRAASDPNSLIQEGGKEKLAQIRKDGGEIMASFDNSAAIKTYETTRQAAAKHLPAGWEGVAGDFKAPGGEEYIKDWKSLSAEDFLSAFNAGKLPPELTEAKVREIYKTMKPAAPEEKLQAGGHGISSRDLALSLGPLQVFTTIFGARDVDVQKRTEWGNAILGLLKKGYDFQAPMMKELVATMGENLNGPSPFDPRPTPAAAQTAAPAPPITPTPAPTPGPSMRAGTARAVEGQQPSFVSMATDENAPRGIRAMDATDEVIDSLIESMMRQLDEEGRSGTFSKRGVRGTTVRSGTPTIRAR